MISFAPSSDSLFDSHDEISKCSPNRNLIDLGNGAGALVCGDGVRRWPGGYWLRDGRRHGGAEEFEGAALDGVEVVSFWMGRPLKVMVCRSRVARWASRSR